MKYTHYLYCPFTGLGLYNGFRGNRWLKNRIQIFKQFVIPSLKAQESKDFILWVSWRPEERTNPIVNEFKTYLENIPWLKSVFTYSGVCFWDDKYPDDEARSRLITSLHGAMGDVLNAAGQIEDTVLMTIQPSDDCYDHRLVRDVQNMFTDHPDIGVLGFRKGYVMDLRTKALAEWNPATIPPFFTIKFPKEVFIDPLKHMNHTGPYKSHEYIGDKLKFVEIEGRGFIVGTHTDNISTVFDHPYAGKKFTDTNDILANFGLMHVHPLEVKYSLTRWVFDRLPYRVKRKLRFWGSEKKWVFRPLFGALYNFLRS